MSNEKSMAGLNPKKNIENQLHSFSAENSTKKECI